MTKKEDKGSEEESVEQDLLEKFASLPDSNPTWHLHSVEEHKAAGLMTNLAREDHYIEHVLWAGNGVVKVVSVKYE